MWILVRITAHLCKRNIFFSHLAASFLTLGQNKGGIYLRPRNHDIYLGPQRRIILEYVGSRQPLPPLTYTFFLTKPPPHVRKYKISAPQKLIFCSGKSIELFKILFTKRTNQLLSQDNFFFLNS